MRNKKAIKEEQGITLMALVITIIVLLILVAISVSAAYNSGIIHFGVQGAKEYAKSAVDENKIMEETSGYIDSVVQNIKDLLANKEDEETQGKAPTDIYAFLYTDGTLAFNNNSVPIKPNEVSKSYGNIKGTTYSYNSDTSKTDAPWYDDRKEITTVNFETEVVPTSTACFFMNCTNLQKIENIKNLDTSQVTNMSRMYQGCSKLTSIDVSSFDTSKVTDMSYMFINCTQLTSIDVSNFNTSGVTDMNSMFFGGSSLNEI